MIPPIFPRDIFAKARKELKNIAEFERQVTSLKTLLPKGRKLSKTDLLKIAQKYMMENGDLSFLDKN